MTSDERYRDYYQFLAKNVVTPFYHERLMYLRCQMSLPKVFGRKNPYLLKAKNITSPDELVRSVVDAFLSSQEETMFGNRLEAFAIHVSESLYGGFKSELPSVDLEFERGDEYYIVEIKSGTDWANSSHLKQMKENFKAARKYLREERGVTKKIVAVNGCIYGKDSKPFKENADPEKNYYKYAGQDFWYFISEDDDLYREIIRPIDEEARQRDEDFKRTYDGRVNGMVKEFGNVFLDAEGLIDWVKLIDYVSKRGKSAITFTRERKTEECAEYEKRKQEEKRRLKEERLKKALMKKQMGS